MRIKIRDFEIELDDVGSRTPLLFIHGYPLARKIWQPQLDDLWDIARMIAPDLRGHGSSQAVPGPYSMDELAEDCRAILENLGVKQRVVLCGLSMGGYVAFAFFRKYPERVAAMILTATRAGADSAEGRAGRDKMIALAQEQGVSAIVDAMLPKLFAPATHQARPELVEDVKLIMNRMSLEGVYGDLAGMRDRPDSTPTLADIHVPTLILHGADDQLIPPSEAEKLRDGIKSATLKLLPQAGHLLNLEQPKLFNEAIRDFWQTL